MTNPSSTPRPAPADATPSPAGIARARQFPAWLGFAVCLFVALLAYLPSALSASFLNFDDNLFFGPDNPLFRTAAERARESGWVAGLLVVLDPRQVVADVYLPVAHGSLWLDYWWFDGRPLGPHVMAVLLHGLAGFVLLRWLTVMRVPGIVAIAAATLFLVHPALCESVAWVSSRKDVLSGLFVFAALGATARFAARSGGASGASAVALGLVDRGLLVAIAACGTLAMYSKATAVVQPLLALLVCWYVPGARRRYLAPLVLLAVTVPIAWHHHSIAASAGTMLGGDGLQRWSQAPGAFVHYGSAALWPGSLNVLYPELQTLERFRAGVWPALGVCVALLLVAIGCWRRPRLRLIGFGVLGFAAALLPFNTALPASAIAVADRYLYLAVPFLALAVVAAGTMLLRRPALVGGMLAVPLLLATWVRAPAFADSTALWHRSLEADGDNAVALLNLISARSPVAVDIAWARPLAERAAAAARYPVHERRARLLLAQYAMAENRFQEAALQAEQAIAATERIAASGQGQVAVVRTLMAQTLLSAITPLRHAGRRDDARAVLQRAEELAPGEPAIVAASVMLAIDALAEDLRTGAAVTVRDDDARVAAIERQLEAVRQHSPDDPQVEFAAGTFARVRGRRLEAIACFRRALARQPEFVDAWLGAAEVCLDAKLSNEAEEYARSGIAVAVRGGYAADPRLRLALARALQGNGRIDEAIESLSVYVRQSPRDRDAARLLSGLLMHKARQRLTDPQVTHAELQRLIDRALVANPREPAVDLIRARLLRDQRRFRDAVEALDRLRIGLPDFEDTPTLLAENLRDLGYERLFAKDDDGAVAAWLRFLEVAPREIATEAVQMQLAAVWRRKADAGVALRAAGDHAAAAAAFRDCLRIDADEHWAAWQLVVGLVDDQAADLDELLDLSDKALRWQQQNGPDCSRQVAVRATVLGRAGREAEALELLDGYLGAPDSAAPIEIVALLRGMRDRLDGR